MIQSSTGYFGLGGHGNKPRIQPGWLFVIEPAKPTVDDDDSRLDRSAETSALKSDDQDMWVVGAFGACGAGPPDAGMRHDASPGQRKALDAIRAFATLNFCTDPAALVQAHTFKGMTGFLHIGSNIGLVTNSSGNRIWNINCEQGGCGASAPPGRKSGLLPGWQ